MLSLKNRAIIHKKYASYPLQELKSFYMAGPLGTGKNYPGLVPKFINFEEFFNFTICSKLWQYEMEVWQIDEFCKYLSYHGEGWLTTVFSCIVSRGFIKLHNTQTARRMEAEYIRESQYPCPDYMAIILL